MADAAHRFLTRDELAELSGRRRTDAQRRELDYMGIPYFVRLDGTLAVLWAHVARDAMIAPSTEPELMP